MTNSDPVPTSPTARALQLGITVGLKPNGKHQVVTTIGGEDFSLSFALPPDAAEESGAKMAEMYTAAADAARRADLGLLIPASASPSPGGLITP